MIEINRNPSPRDLRIFSLGLIVFCAAIAVVLHVRHAQTVAAAAVSVTGMLLGIVCWSVPSVARRLYVAWMLAFFPVGWIVSHVVLLIVFYAVLTPIGLLLRLCRHDPLHRRFDAKAHSYWLERRERPRPRDYFRPF